MLFSINSAASVKLAGHNFSNVGGGEASMSKFLSVAD